MARYLSPLLAFLLLAACGEQPRTPDPATDPTIDEVAARSTVVTVAHGAGLSTLNAAISQADLVETLAAEGPYTLFAPSDEAFDRLPAGTLDALLEPRNQGALRDVLLYHALPQHLAGAQISGEMTVTTVNGESLTLNATDQGVTLTDAVGNTVNVITSDLQAENGVVHVIDGVLLHASPDDILDRDAL